MELGNSTVERENLGGTNEAESCRNEQQDEPLWFVVGYIIGEGNLWQTVSNEILLGNQRKEAPSIEPL